MSENTIFADYGQFISRKELLTKYSPYMLSSFVKNGHLTKINNVFYQNNDYEGEESDLFYAAAYIPNGVISLMSAAVYYGLSNNRPLAIDVAVRANSYIPSFPDWPPIRIHYLEKKYYDNGIITINERGNTFRVYETEKVVADVVKNRERIGIEETKEVLTNYLKSSDRDLNKLMKYAKAGGCDKQMRTYMEVLV